MKIVFDLDNTLIDELGKGVRPGIVDVLQALKARGHVLTLWTNSRRERAAALLANHKLQHFFSELIFREDYDLQDTGRRKDLRSIRAQVLVDDDPAEIAWNRARGIRAIQVAPYRTRSNVPANEASRLLSDILSADTLWLRARILFGFG